MSIGGIEQQMDRIISKYQRKQLTKFVSIAAAELNGDEADATNLISSFVDDEDANFSLFVEDLAILEKSGLPQAQLLSQLNKKLIEKIDSDILLAEQKRGAILTKYEDGIGAAVGSFRPQQNGHTANHSSANPSNDGSKKRRSGCTIV